MPPGGRRPPEVIAEEELRRRVSELAAQIDEDYAGVEELVLVGVLKGAFVFLSDLARGLSVPTVVEFVALSSYDGTEAGELRLEMDLREEVRGRHVLVVEDIVDSGATLRRLREMLGARGPASLATCVLVRKEGSARHGPGVDYLGFRIPDVWAVGYGLDHEERFRGLPYVGELPEGEAPGREGRG